MTSKGTPAFLVSVQDYSKVNGAIHTANKISPTKLHVAYFVTQYTDLYNVTHFYCRRVKVISFTPIAEVRPSLRRIFQKRTEAQQLCADLFRLTPLKSDSNVQSAGILRFTPSE